jgi:hypothetical protein
MDYMSLLSGYQGVLPANQSYIPSINNTQGAAQVGAYNPYLQQYLQNKAASVASGNDFFDPSRWNTNYGLNTNIISSSGTPTGASDDGLNELGEPKVSSTGSKPGYQGDWDFLQNAGHSMDGYEPDRSLSGGGSSGGGGGGTGGSGSGSEGTLGGQLGSGTGGLNLGGGTQGLVNPAIPGGSTVGYQAPVSGGTPGGFQVNAPAGQLPVGAQGGVVGMQQANPQDTMNKYLQTPGNQLLGDPSYQRFQHSPGYQYAVNEALRQVQGNASNRGLLESGAVMRGMTDRAQGMALQDYGNWWNRQNSLYSDYQNRLSGLAGGPTGADQAYGMGQAQAAGTMQTGSNLGSLFGNQGNAGFGGIMNTGAAQANSMTQAGAQQAQILGANQATQLAGATARQGGLF